MSKILLSVLTLIPLVMVSPAFAQIAVFPDNMTGVENVTTTTTEKKPIAALVHENGTMVQNLTVTDLCSDYDKDGICGSGKLIEGLTCVDANHDFRCDWLKVNTTKPIPDISHLKGMSVKACPEQSPDPSAVFEEICDWYANGTIVFTPIVQVKAPALIVQVPTPTPAPVPAPMAQLAVKQPVKETNNNDDDDDNDNNRNDDDDLPPCSPDTIYKECADTDRDDEEEDLPNCNDVEYGTHCDGSEDENSWTDEEEEEESNTDESSEEEDDENQGTYEDDGYLDEEGN